MKKFVGYFIKKENKEEIKYSFYARDLFDADKVANLLADDNDLILSYWEEI